MAPAILLVDDQHDVLRLLHSALDTLRRPDLEILEAGSAEEAARVAAGRPIDLLVTDYRLPGMSGIELMHKVRGEQPDVKVILITGVSDRKTRDEVRNAGAAAFFDKPIPLGDFLDAVERNLGLDRTIFPSQPEEHPETGPTRFSDLLANFRQDVQASAVFLINDRGLVVARAGDLRDTSMEVSLVSALAASFSAGLKVANANRQEGLDQFSVFSGGNHDLILVPIDASYALLLATNDLAGRGALFDTIRATLAVRNEVGQALRSIGAAAESLATPPGRKRKGKTGELSAGAPELESLLKAASDKKPEPADLDAFWDQAAAQHANKPTSSDVIPYEEARKMGLAPDEK